MLPSRAWKRSVQSPEEVICKASLVPTVRLNTGRPMPVLAVGTGGLSGMGGLSTDDMLVEAFRLGYNHIDTSDVYPAFRQGRVAAGLAALASAGYPRSCYFLTSKVDMTSPAARAKLCAVNGTGCFEQIRLAVSAQLQLLRTPQIDLMLLHRPPSGLRGLTVQCTQVRAMWRGLEAAMADGEVAAIGLSNFCVDLVRCLLSRSATVPSVLQQMHRLGMGRDPFGYVTWTRSLGMQYMAYSVLGGADRKSRALRSLKEVSQIAEYHAISAAEIAMLWVIQQEIPLVVLSNTVRHLASNLRLVTAPAVSLSVKEMGRLSALRKPAGRPSYWGDCVDTAAPRAHPLSALLGGSRSASGSAANMLSLAKSTKRNGWTQAGYATIRCSSATPLLPLPSSQCRYHKEDRTHMTCASMTLAGPIMFATAH